MEPLLPDTVDTLLINCHIATMSNDELSTIKNAALAVTKDCISWVGKAYDLPSDFKNSCKKIIDCNNGWILPGFVDCHPHLI